MADLKVGASCIHRTEPGVSAKVIAIDDEDVTLIVDGYAASDTYRFQQFAEEWELVDA